MKLEKKREKFLGLLRTRECPIKEFRENYIKLDIFNNLKGLLKYHKKYLKYIFSKIKPLSVKSKTFWGEEIWTSLPKELGLYFFGSLGSEQEIRLIKFCINNFKEDFVFYDIGAHCGFYSMLAKQFLDKGEIHAFEPVPKIFDYLQKNLLDQKRVFLNSLALFDKEGKIDFYEDMQGGGRSSAILLNLTSDSRHPPFRKVKVYAMTLDQYCLKHSSPDFIKIDVEGSEFNVIRGGIKTLSNTNLIIAIEVCREPLYNKPHLEAMKILYNLGYYSYRINDNGELRLVKKINPEKDIDKKLRWDNFIFTKKVIQ